MDVIKDLEQKVDRLNAEIAQIKKEMDEAVSQKKFVIAGQKQELTKEKTVELKELNQKLEEEKKKPKADRHQLKIDIERLTKEMEEAATQKKFVLAGQLQTELEKKQNELEQLGPDMSQILSQIIEQLKRELADITREMQEAASQKKYVLAGQKQEEKSAKELELKEVMQHFSLTNVSHPSLEDDKEPTNVSDSSLVDDKESTNVSDPLTEFLNSLNLTLPNYRSQFKNHGCNSKEDISCMSDDEWKDFMDCGEAKESDVRKIREILVKELENEKAKLEKGIKQLQILYNDTFEKCDFVNASKAEAEKEERENRLERVKQLLSKSPYLRQNDKAKKTGTGINYLANLANPYAGEVTTATTATTTASSHTMG